MQEEPVGGKLGPDHLYSQGQHLGKPGSVPSARLPKAAPAQQTGFGRVPLKEGV